MEFSHELALALVQFTDQFPVDFDAAWKWIGYSTEQKAKNNLTNTAEVINQVKFLNEGNLVFFPVVFSREIEE